MTKAAATSSLAKAMQSRTEGGAQGPELLARIALENLPAWLAENAVHARKQEKHLAGNQELAQCAPLWFRYSSDSTAGLRH